MRKGMLSLDLLIALVLLTFLVIWVQDYFVLISDNVDATGVSMQLKTGAIQVGTQMNIFYAGAESGEKMDITSFNISGFPDATVKIEKKDNIVNVSALGKYATYPVVKELTYDADKGEVSR